MKPVRKRNTDRNERCAYCGSQQGIVWVHGHGQCVSCGINVEECCRGEQCEGSGAASGQSYRAS